jgi:RNA polymerase sigma factor (TIGR02999 family)
MMQAAPGEITDLLKAWRGGDGQALERLTALVYDHLRQLARQHLRKERANELLDPTALVHEAYLRLIDARTLNWHDRGHFFAVSATIMRRILVDAARSRATVKRGGHLQRVEHSTALDFDRLPAPGTDQAAQVCALDEALNSLAQIDPRAAKVVELRFFGGLSVEEAGEALGVSAQTVVRDWKLARAWLSQELGRE